MTIALIVVLGFFSLVGAYLTFTGKIPVPYQPLNSSAQVPGPKSLPPKTHVDIGNEVVGEWQHLLEVKKYEAMLVKITDHRANVSTEVLREAAEAANISVERYEKDIRKAFKKRAKNAF